VDYRLKAAVKKTNWPAFFTLYFANHFLLAQLRSPHYLLLQAFVKRKSVHKQVSGKSLRFTPVALVFSYYTPADRSPLLLDVLLFHFVLWHVSNMQQGHWVLYDSWQVFYNFLDLVFAFTSEQSFLNEMKDCQTYAKQHAVAFQKVNIPKFLDHLKIEIITEQARKPLESVLVRTVVQLVEMLH